MPIASRKAIVRQINNLIPGCHAHQEVVVRLQVGKDRFGNPVDRILCRIVKSEDAKNPVCMDVYNISHSWSELGAGGMCSASSWEPLLLQVQNLKDSLLRHVQEDPAKFDVVATSSKYEMT